MGTVTFTPGAVVIDVNDLDRQIAFWAGLLDMQVRSKEEGWVELGALGVGGPTLCLQLVPERKTQKNRLHTDWMVSAFPAAAERARSLGATAVSSLHEPQRPWQVFADPEGNEFCLISGD